MKRKKVYKILDGERDYQDMRWNESTTDSRGIHPPSEWLVFIQHYLTEAIHKATRFPDPKAKEETMIIIRKIAAMGVCAMEQNGCPPRVVKVLEH